MSAIRKSIRKSISNITTPSPQRMLTWHDEPITAEITGTFQLANGQVIDGKTYWIRVLANGKYESMCELLEIKTNKSHGEQLIKNEYIKF